MAREIVIEPEAGADLADANDWYESQRMGLGSEFLAEVAHTIRRIETFPEEHRVMRGDTRRALIRRFSYGIFYIVEPDLIAITAVLHARRDPRRWQER